MPEGITATCPFCSLHCADLRLIMDGDRLVVLTPACPQAEAGYKYSMEAARHIIAADADLVTAREWLQRSRQPLVLLTGNVENEAVQAAARLARLYSAFLTCTDDRASDSLNQSMTQAGWLGGSIGELKTAEMVIIFGSEALNAAPRLAELLPKEATDRVVYFNPTEPLQAVRLLRSARRAEPIDPPAEIAALDGKIRQVKSGALLLEAGWFNGNPTLPTELLLWLQELNRDGHWYGYIIPAEANSIGVSESLLAETGFSCSLRFQSGKVNHDPRLWKAEKLFGKGRTDCCLVIGTAGVFGDESARRLTAMQTIVISPEKPTWAADLWIPCAKAGVDCAGTMQRLDGVPLLLQRIRTSKRRQASDLLLELCDEAEA